MKADRPCNQFEPGADAPALCYWCGWDQVPHLVPETDAFETTYWETLATQTDDTD